MKNAERQLLLAGGEGDTATQLKIEELKSALEAAEQKAKLAREKELSFSSELASKDQGLFTVSCWDLTRC